MAKVKIFTTPSCTYCNQAKDFFKENNVEFEAIDVTQDKAAAEEMVEKMNIKLSGRVVTKISLVKNYCPAEEYHQRYLEKR